MAQFKLIIAEKNLLFVLISCYFSSGNGEKAGILKNTEVSIGATAILHCKSPISSIEWLHMPIGRSVGLHEIVYQDGYIFNGYKERFSVNRKDNGEYDLVIKNVKTADAGTYTCVQKSEEAVQKSAELIVFEQYPSNKSCAAKFTCTPLCDALELTCSMKSHGNINPSMEWRESSKGILTFNSKMENGTTISYIHVDLQRSPSDSQSYVCRVKYQIDSSMTTKFSWSYLVNAPDFRVLSDEESQVQPTTKGVIVLIAFLVAALAATIAATGILYFKIKRKKAEPANPVLCTGNTESANPNHAENCPGSEIEPHCSGPEIELLLTPEDQDDKASGIVPRTPLNKNKSIFGIGVLDDEIFLVTRDGCIIEVYELESAKFRRAWMVEGLINSCDMAICPIKSLIFICDWKKTGRRNEIVCYDKNGKLSCRWTPQNERGRISVTKKTNVIVAENYFNTINEYTQSGTNVDKLHTGKIHLEHAVKLENENFVASFGDVNDDIREICIINSHAEVLHSINQNTHHKQYGLQFSAPRSLAVDKEGNIYVSDLYNGKIILLSSKLQYKGKIDEGENEENLRGPLRMCLHESHNKRQFVIADSVKKDGEWIDGKIVVSNLPPALTTAMNQTC